MRRSNNFLIFDIGSVFELAIFGALFQLEILDSEMLIIVMRATTYVSASRRLLTSTTM